MASIFAIAAGAKAEKLAAQAQEMGARYGIGGGGKAMAGKIMGKIGKIMGIVMTAFWGFYLLYFLVIILSAMASASAGM